jgi:hypothetical protein
MSKSWFNRSTDGMPDLGQGEGWTPASWRRAPRKQVPVDKLVATNRRGYLDERRATKYARNGRGGDVYVVEHQGRYYIADGHHRAVAAMMRGKTTIAVRVKKPGDRS